MWVIWKNSRGKYRRNDEGNCIRYFVRYFKFFLSICKSIDKFITDRLTNKPEIFDGLFLSVNPLVKYLLIDYECKYRWKFMLVKLLNLVVLNAQTINDLYIMLSQMIIALYPSSARTGFFPYFCRNLMEWKYRLSHNLHSDIISDKKVTF